MGIKDELKQQYSSLAIGKLESMIQGSRTVYEQSRVSMIKMLYYLEFTRRFRENKEYKDANFKDYLLEVHGMRYNTYLKERYAVLHYPEESKIVSPALISKVVDNCGPRKSKELIQEMASIKGKKDFRKKVDKLINENIKKKPPKKKSPTRAELELCILNLQQDNIALRKEIEEKDAQILRLKATVREYKEKAVKLANYFTGEGENDSKRRSGRPLCQIKDVRGNQVSQSSPY